MTEDPGPLSPSVERVLEVALALLCWALAGLAIGFEVWSAVIPVAHIHESTGTKVSDLVSVGGLGLLAIYAPILEWVDRHDSARRRFWYRTGWAAQGLLIIICVSGAVSDHQILVIPWLVSTIFMGSVAWHIWMRSQRLPVEDQKVIDELIAEGDRRNIDAIRAAEHRRREARFQQVAARYQPAGPGRLRQPPAPVPLAQPYDWQIPEGKHRALVYFVRNGDRVKIGTTTNLRNRVSNLSLRPSDIVLLLPGGRPHEQSLHARFAPQRVGNTEWFELAGPVAAFIEVETAKVRATAKTGE